MDWVKKNLGLVIAGGVALVLLGASGFFLYSNLSKEKEIDAQLAEKKAAIDALATAKPHPNDENIKAAKADFQRVHALLQDYRKFFTPFQYPQFNDSLDFKTMLAVTVDQLHQQANSSKILIQSNYYFSFESQKLPTLFEPGTIQPLTERLVEVRAICDILFRAQIRMLESIQRTSVSPKIDNVSADLISVAPVTNAAGISMPYQVSFVAYAAQLAEVLNGLAQSPHCFVVKSMTVVTNAPVTSATTVAPSPTVYTPGMPMAGAENVDSAARMRMRYGARAGGGGASPETMRRYGRAPGGEGVQVAPVPQLPRRGPETIVEEVPLKATIRIDVVKIKLPTDEGQPRSSARAAR